MQFSRINEITNKSRTNAQCFPLKEIMICWHFDKIEQLWQFKCFLLCWNESPTAKEKSCMNITPKTIRELFICRHTADSLSLSFQLKANMYLRVCLYARKCSCAKSKKCHARNGQWNVLRTAATEIMMDRH